MSQLDHLDEKALLVKQALLHDFGTQKKDGAEAYQVFISDLDLPLNADENDTTSYTLNSPVDGTVLGQRAKTSADETAGILERAQNVHTTLSRISLDDRVRLITDFNETVFPKLQEAIALSITANMGKSYSDAKGELGKAGGWGDFCTSDESVNYIKDYAEDGVGVRTGMHVRDGSGNAITEREQLSGKMLFTKYPDIVPAGVSGSVPSEDNDIQGNGICVSMPPTNYPFALGVGDMMLSMLAGNASIIKPPSQTPDPESIFCKFFNEHAADWLAEHREELTYKDSGPVLSDEEIETVRAGAAQVVNSYGWEEHANNFRIVGGMNAGISTYENRAAQADGESADTKRGIYELAGDNPMFIGETIKGDELETAAQKYMDRVASNSGMICTRINCAMVQEGETFDAFKASAVEKFKSYDQNWQDKIGNPYDDATVQGALINEAEFNHMQSYIKEVEALGAEVIGGKRVMEDTGGVYVTPALVLWAEDQKDDYRDIRARGEEVFAPITNLMPVADVDEAIDITNLSYNNLSSSVWSHDAQEVAAFIKDTDLGSYNINNPKHGSDNAPIGEHMGKYIDVERDNGQVVRIDHNGPTGGLAHIAHHLNVVPQNPEYAVWMDEPDEATAIRTLIESGVDLRMETDLGDDVIDALNEEYDLAM